MALGIGNTQAWNGHKQIIIHVSVSISWWVAPGIQNTQAYEEGKEILNKARRFTHTYVHIHASIYIHIHIYMYTNTHINTHTHTHTHTRTYTTYLHIQAIFLHARVYERKIEKVAVVRHKYQRTHFLDMFNEALEKFELIRDIDACKGALVLLAAKRMIMT